MTIRSMRLEAISSLSQQDSMKQDIQSRNEAIHDLLSMCGQTGKALEDNHSADSAYTIAQNRINDFKSGNIPNSTNDIARIENQADTLRGLVSTVKTDEQDSKKLNNFIGDKYSNKLSNHVMRISELNSQDIPKPTPPPINVETWTHHSQNERALVKRLESEINNLERVNSFNSSYKHMQPGFQKYITQDNQTFYFPINWINYFTRNPTKVPRMISNYNKTNAGYRRDVRLVNNGYRQLHDLEINHKWFKFDNHDPYMTNANTAAGKYQYQTVHDEIWEQYRKDLFNNYANLRDKLSKEITRGQNEMNNRRGHWHWWSKNINDFRTKRNQIQQQVNHENNKYNWWVNRINSRNQAFGNHLQNYINTWNRLGTIANVRADNRYTHFGYIRPINPNSDHSYIYFMVTDESPTYETNVSQTPVEWGVNMTTGTQKQQTAVSISGTLFNPNFSNLNPADGSDGYNADGSNDNTNLEDTANPSGEDQVWRQYWDVRDQAKVIAGWANQGAEMFYSGQDWFPHCVISEFNPDYSNSGDDGSLTTVNFSMTLQLCDYFQSNESSPTHSTSSHNVGNKGCPKGKHSMSGNGPKYLRIKKGWTYWQLNRDKGIPISKLERLNPQYAVRRLPIGGKLRIN